MPADTARHRLIPLKLLYSRSSAGGSVILRYRESPN